MIESNVIMKQFKGPSNSVAFRASDLADKNLSLSNSTAYILSTKNFSKFVHVHTSALF